MNDLLPKFYKTPEEVPVAPFYVKVYDNYLSDWGNKKLPKKLFTLFPCQTQEDMEVVEFNCNHCREDFLDVETFRRGEPRYKLPRDKKIIEENIAVYRGSIVAGFIAMGLLSGSGMWEWMQRAGKNASVDVIEPKGRWLIPGMDREYIDENGVRFKFVDIRKSVNAGQYFLDMPRVIDRELPKRGRSYQRKTIWIVKKKRKEKWGTLAPIVELVQ